MYLVYLVYLMYLMYLMYLVYLTYLMYLHPFWTIVYLHILLLVSSHQAHKTWTESPSFRQNMSTDEDSFKTASIEYSLKITNEFRDKTCCRCAHERCFPISDFRDVFQFPILEMLLFSKKCFFLFAWWIVALSRSNRQSLKESNILRDVRLSPWITESGIGMDKTCCRCAH